MKLKSLKCPECNANIKIDEGRKSCFCTYCGCSILVDDESTTVNYNHTYTKRDEAKIREIELKETIRLKQLENEVREKKIEHIEKYIAVAFVIFLVLLMCFAFNSLEKSEKNIVTMPCSMTDYKGENYEVVIQELNNLGFHNVETAEKKDLVLGWLTKDGEVYKVSINGNSEFEKGDRFPKSAKVVVTYHTYKD